MKNSNQADRLLSMLGICKKAGKLAEGFDPVAEAAGKGRARLILTASDLSPKSEKEAARVAALSEVEYVRIPITMDELWSRLGRRSGILAVADDGLAISVKNIAAAAGMDGAMMRQDGCAGAAVEEESSLCQ